MTDHRIPLIVVSALALVVVLGAALMGYLASTQTAIPDQLDRLVVGALGGLVGILATTRGGDTPTPVTVENEGPGEAIPTTDVPARARGAKGAVDAVTALVMLLLVVAIMFIVTGGDFRF